MSPDHPDDFQTLYPPPGDDEQPGVPNVPPPSEATESEIPPPPIADDAPTLGADDPNDKTFVGVPESSGLADAEALRTKLLGLRLITEEQWDEAVRASGGSSDQRAIVNRFQDLPAEWYTGSDLKLSALTPFQIRQILADNAELLRLQHYVILDRLGAGGMGEVFLARNLNLPRVEAVKTLLQHDTAPGETHVNSKLLDRFEREARVLAQLNHRYITTIHHAGWEGDTAFIAMEYVKGQDMKAIVEQAKADADTIPVWWAVERIVAVAEALGHAHQHGVVHRDVKPSNIMITDDNELKVLDMGIARLVSSSGGAQTTQQLTQDSAGLGTPEVMPPEQWADPTSVTAASDIYSLGCTLFYMLTGQMPFLANNINELMFCHLNDDPPKASSFRKDIPPGLDAVLAKMLAKEPSDRYGNCAELLEDLWPFAQQQGEESVAPMPVGRPGNSALLVGTGLIGAFLLVLGLVAGVWYLKRSPAPPPKVDYVAESRQWLDSHFAKHQAIWGERAQLDEFAYGDPPRAIASVGDLEQLEDRVTLEASARTERVDEANRWLQDYQRSHAKIWPKLAALEAFAASTVPQETLATPDGLKRLRESVEAETKKRDPASMQAQTRDQRLDAFQRVNADVWPDLKGVKSFVDSRLPSGEKATEKQWQGALTELEKQTWQMRADDWLTSYAASTPSVWPSERDLRKFVVESLDNDVTDKAGLDKLQELVRQQTRKLIQERTDKTLARVQQEYPELWPNMTILKRAMESRLPLQELQSESEFKRWEEELEKLTRARVFDGVRLRPVGDAKKDYNARLFLAAYKLWLPIGDDGKKDQLTVETLVDGVDTRTIAVGKKVTLRIKPKISGFLTMLVFESSGKQFLFAWKEPLEKSKGVNLFRTTAESPGTDRFVLFVTPTNPEDVLPAAPEGMTRTITQKGFLGGWVVPPFLMSREDLARFESAFPDPAIYQKVVESLRSGEPYPARDSQSATKGAYRQSVEINMVEQP
ncbi:Serine/threonine-protein kinase PknB [Planctomycetes bacterium Pan216]|uniref:Serine/threonine-protein kinase PknB n=1 Tax=Kolteria novifilia TaxID=2527975 RepID=A0A518AY65_9BACT|nr:Serine/threonine-protein kinase PknB [Planctomycetes bacterium Pan216]